jgi:adenosylmethionine-8-amino-7-oxononanoate aminotransferase
MLFKVHFAPSPYVYRWAPSQTGERPSPEQVRDACLAELGRILEQHAGTIAAVCIEPIVQGAGGMIVQPPGFLRGVVELARRHDVLVICDEVATGFGRTGHMFAVEHESVEPDLMCLGKGITGGYLPLAATLATQRIFDAFLGQPWEGRTFFHGHTYTGNALACAAANASLDLFEQNGLVEQVQARSTELAGLLEPLAALPHVGDIRHKGLMVGIELVADKATRRQFDHRRRVGAQVCMNVRRHGVILRPLGDVIVVMPPLAMGSADLRTIIDAASREIAAVTE